MELKTCFGILLPCSHLLPIFVFMGTTLIADSHFRLKILAKNNVIDINFVIFEVHLRLLRYWAFEDREYYLLGHKARWICMLTVLL